MIGAITILASFITLFTLLAFGVRLALQKRKLSHPTFLVWLVIISATSFISIDLAYKFAVFRAFFFFPLENALILMLEFSYFALLVFLSLKDPSTKKMKTLMRLPVIGGLLGWYMGYIHVALIFALVEIAGLFLLKRLKAAPFVWRAHLKSFALAPLLCFYTLPTNLWFTVFLLWSVFFKLTVANAAIVKNLMLDYDRELDDEK